MGVVFALPFPAHCWLGKWGETLMVEMLTGKETITHMEATRPFDR